MTDITSLITQITGVSIDWATTVLIEQFIIFITIVILVVEAVVLYLAIQAILALISEVNAPMLDKELPEVRAVTASEGSKMWFACGRRASLPGTILWKSETREYKEEVEIDGAETEVTRYSVSYAIAWGRAMRGSNNKGRTNKIVNITANGKLLWKNGAASKFDHRYGSLSNYLGTSTQNADSVIEEDKGSGNVPGFREITYTVIEDFELRDFGNQVPITQRALIQPDDEPYTLADAISDVWDTRPGADSSTELDVSSVTGRNVIAEDDGVRTFQGFQTEAPFSPIDVLSTFTQVFDLTVRHSDGKLVFLDRGDEPVIAIEEGHLGCTTEQPGTNRPLEITDIDVRQRPTAVTINFLAKDARYQRSSETYRTNSDRPEGATDNIATINYEGVLRRAQARRVAKRRLAESYRVSQNAYISGLPSDYMTTEPGDVLAVPFGGQVYYVRVQEITVGANYLIEIRGVVEQIRAGEDEILTTAGSNLGTDQDDDDDGTDNSDNDDPEDGPDGGYTPPLVRKVPTNLPPLFADKEVKDGIFLYAHCAEDPEATWKGSQGYLKVSGSSYKKFSAPYAEASIAIAITALPDTSAWHMFDSGSSFTVQMLHGAPSSATREEVEQGTNWIAVGSIADDNFEVIGFKTATPIASTVTDLTGLSCGIAANIFTKTGGTSFVTLGVVVGQYVRITGLQEVANQDLFREVLAVTSDTITLSEDAGDLDDEGPLGASDTITIEVGSGKYTLSGMFRGLRDTYDHIDSHAVGELVVWLKPTSTKWVGLPNSKIKKDVDIKDVPKGQGLSDVLSETFTYQAETLRPFRPCWLRYEREYIGLDVELEPEYDITISWVHRTRFPFPDPTTENIPHAELDHEGKQDKYVIELYSDSGRTALFRTIEVTAQDDHDVGDTEDRREVTYTTAQQDNDVTNDGITKNAAIYGRIWQVGTTVKKGNVLDFVIDAV